MMTNLIYFEIPLLVIIPLAAAVISVITAVLGKIHILPWVSALLHGVLIAVLFYFGGGLADILVMLMLSLIASFAFGLFKKTDNKGGSKQ